MSINRVRRWVRSAIRIAAAPGVFLIITLYFGWNVTQGAHGLYAYEKQLVLLDQAKLAYKNALTERDFWRQRVDALSEQNLDLDILDERARAMLNIADKDDIVVPYNWYKPPT